MPKYTMHLVLEEIYTCRYVVEADNEEEAEDMIREIERQVGINANETEVFNWDYYGSELKLSCGDFKEK
tara:strand:- start:276 stop:482 length:207 start_codon:yes stop_codon:yes gene_type:complete